MLPQEPPALSDVFKALADEGRRRLLDELRVMSELTLGELCERKKMTRQAVAKQLKVLEEAGLVEYVWKGREKLHSFNPEPLLKIAEWLERYPLKRPRSLAELYAYLETPPNAE